MFIVTIVDADISLIKYMSSYKFLTCKPKTTNTRMFEDTNGVFKRCTLLKDRQCNGQHKTGKLLSTKHSTEN